VESSCECQYGRNGENEAPMTIGRLQEGAERADESLFAQAGGGPEGAPEIASRLGIEEPTLVTLLHRLEGDGWVTRKSAEYDRRCKLVHLGRRAQSVIAQINATAAELRHELLADIPSPELKTCMRVLSRIQTKAEQTNHSRNGGSGVVKKGSRR